MSFIPSFQSKGYDYWLYLNTYCITCVMAIHFLCLMRLCCSLENGHTDDNILEFNRKLINSMQSKGEKIYIFNLFSRTYMAKKHHLYICISSICFSCLESILFIEVSFTIWDQFVGVIFLKSTVPETHPTPHSSILHSILVHANTGSCTWGYSSDTHIINIYKMITQKLWKYILLLCGKQYYISSWDR